MLTLESFDRMRDGVSGQFEQQEVFIRIFVHEKECPMKELQHINESRRWAAEVVLTVPTSASGTKRACRTSSSAPAPNDGP